MAEGISVSISLPSAKLEELKRRIDPRKVVPAIVSAANKTAAKLRTYEAKETVAELNVSKADLKGVLTVRRATYSKPSASVMVSRKPFALSKYPVQQTPTGVLSTPRKTVAGSVSPKTRPYSFLATLASGHVGVWVRHGPKVVPSKGRYAGRFITRGPNKGKPIMRQQLEQKYGPTIVGVLAGKPGLKEKFQEFADTDFPKQIDSQITRFLKLQEIDS